MSNYERPSVPRELPEPFDAKKAYELLEWFERAKQEHLLRHPNFVPKRHPFSFGRRPSKCEAGALTTELTARTAHAGTKKQQCNYIHFLTGGQPAGLFRQL